MLFLIQHMTDQVSGAEAALSLEQEEEFAEQALASFEREASENAERELARIR